MSRFSGRPLERLWFYFFLLHIPITLFIDCQHLLPSFLRPFPHFMPWYLTQASDPILKGAFFGGKEWDWIRLFLQMELGFQIPCFVIGAWGLWYDDWRTYPVILAYAAQAATTMVPVLHALYVDTTVPTQAQRMQNWVAFGAFGLIFVAILLHIGGKTVKLLGDAQRAERRGKGKNKVA